MKKTIGILGGMGPLATVELMKSITLMTDADSDNEHIHLIVDSNIAIPDRTAAILKNGEDPRPELIRTAKRLEQAGADVLIMPCNTAHYYLKDIVAQVQIPFISMITETVREAKRLSLDTVGVLSTAGTAQSGVYDTAFQAENIRVLKPDAEEQACVTDIIYKGVKAGNFSLDTAAIRQLITQMQSSGAEALVLGCTELPIAFERFGLPGRILDPSRILAARAIEYVGGKVKIEEHLYA